METENSEVTLLDETSSAYIGRWNRLVSTTNWDKGRIIYEWRSALQAADAPMTEYSDEAWSRLVGGVTGQHAGRLRRVYDRFGDVYGQYEGLFWSHFQASLDWDDAEMWLEGALQSSWSVAEMRRRRWQTMGAVDADRPRDEEIVATELDEDFSVEAKSAEARDSGEVKPSADHEVAYDTQESRSPAGPDFGDEEEIPRNKDFGDHPPHASFGEPSAENSGPRIRPFAELPPLPDDLAQAFESFQLAVLRHRAEGWTAVSQSDVIAALQALQTLILAPPDGDA